MAISVGRDPAGRKRAELFLIAAVVTVLATRGYLAATGYPKIGSGGLHVAHVLFGGLFMLVAMLLVLLTFGSSAERVASWLGGIGFGLFIDELGKFLTSDNNYFFQPAIALMYLIFVVAFIAVRAVPDHRMPSRAVSLGYAYSLLTDSALGKLNAVHRRQALTMLARFPEDEEALAVADLLRREPVEHTHRGPLFRARRWIVRSTRRLLLTRVAQGVIIAFFLLQAVGLILSLVFSVIDQDTGFYADSSFSDWGGGLTSIAVGVLSVVGAVELVRRRRLAALRWFHLAALMSLLVGQIFLFAEDQFAALPDLAFNLLVLAALRLAISAQTASDSEHAASRVARP